MQLWPRLMASLKDELLSREDRKRPIIVAFYCKSGKHRSVGLAWTLTKILRSKGWNVDLWHTMQHYWAFDTCRECAMCANDTPEKLGLLFQVNPISQALPQRSDCM